MPGFLRLPACRVDPPVLQQVVTEVLGTTTDPNQMVGPQVRKLKNFKFQIIMFSVIAAT